MLKRLMYIIFGIVFCFSALTIFILSNIKSIMSHSKSEIEMKNPGYKSISIVLEKTMVLKDLVTQAALVKIEDEIETNKKLANELILEIRQEIFKINSDYLTELNLSLSEQERITLNKLEEKIKPIEAYLKESLVSSAQLLVNSTGLDNEKKELSKLFRSASQTLGKHKDAWAKLSRATIVVLSSRSNKDIAYSGRAVFTDAQKYYDEINLTTDDKLIWDDLKAQFSKTLDLAIKVSSVGEDNHLGTFRNEISGLIVDLNTLKQLAQHSFEQGQIGIVNIASSSYLNSLVFGVIIILISLGFSVTTIRGAKKMILNSVQSLTEITTHLKSSSEHFLGLSQELSKQSKEQSDGIHETSAAVEQITSMVAQTESRATTSASLADNTAELATSGEQLMTETKQAIDSLKNSIELLLNESKKSSVEFNQTAEIIKNIGTRVVMINDIVFQTKLLSFNASVEAARAGENGKGFAVVAQEIGNLANVSGRAAQEINQIVGESQNRVSTLVESMEQNVGKVSQITVEAVQHTLKSVEKSYQSFIDITQAIRELREHSAHIARASSEQARGIEEVNNVVRNFESMNVKLMGNSDKSLKSAQGLEKNASELANQVLNLENSLFKGNSSSVDLGSSFMHSTHETSSGNKAEAA